LDTRPTSDRAKENLFNILAPEIRGSRFLDIFCGSGAIGIEALSRGAKEAVFVENSPPALKAVKQNLEKTKLQQNAEILELSVEQAITRLSTKSRQFDIIFLDPPYDSPLLAQTLEQLRQSNLLAENGQIVAETDTRSPFDVFVKSGSTHRIYGRTMFLFFPGDSI
jgi:16S rRNA (guanine966-N2)-methyltransferase